MGKVSEKPVKSNILSNCFADDDDDEKKTALISFVRHKTANYPPI